MDRCCLGQRGQTSDFVHTRVSVYHSACKGEHSHARDLDAGHVGATRKASPGEHLARTLTTMRGTAIRVLGKNIPGVCKGPEAGSVLGEPSFSQFDCVCLPALLPTQLLLLAPLPLSSPRGCGVVAGARGHVARQVKPCISDRKPLVLDLNPLGTVPLW